MVKVGDKVKIYRSGFWYTTGTVVEVKNGRVTAKFREPDGEERTVTGPEKWCEVVKKK